MATLARRGGEVGFNVTTFFTECNMFIMLRSCIQLYMHACMHLGFLADTCIHASELKYLLICSKICLIRLNHLKLLFYSATSSS